MSATWPIRKLRDIADIRVSNVDKKTHASEKPVKLCNYMDVYTNQYVTGAVPFMEASASTAEIERFGLRSGDVIITKDSETPDDIGIPAVIAEEIGGLVCGYHLALIRPNPDEVDSIYLAKQLSTSRVARYFALRASGSTRYGLPISAIESVEIPTPLKPEQSKIAEILSTVDRAIEQTEALIAKQQRIKTGLMQDLLTRGIDDHGNLRSELTHKFKNSSIMGTRIPERWKDCTFRHVTKVNQGLQIPIEERFNEDGNNRYKYITVQYLNNPERYLEFIENPPLQLVCSSDDILFTRTGNTGQIITGVEGVYHNNFFKIAYDKKSVRKDYLIHFLNWQPIQDMIIELAGTTTIPDLNHGDFYALPLFLPTSDEQKQIEVILTNQDVEINTETSKLKKYKSIKTALMQDLLTGKKRVTTLMADTEVKSV